MFISMFNFGPNHPSAHGVLRLIVCCIYEFIVSIFVLIGLLHSSSVKLFEFKWIFHCLPYCDSLDYVSCFSQEDCLYLCLCKLSLVLCDFSTSFISVICLELTSSLNHTLGIVCFISDLGALTPILWLFEFSESVFELFDRLSGSSMHSFILSIEFCLLNIWSSIIKDCLFVFIVLSSILDELIDLLETSIVLFLSSSFVCSVWYLECLMFNFTGIMISSSGFILDFSLTDIFTYYSFGLIVCLNFNSDCMDRFNCSFGELFVSTLLVFIGVQIFNLDLCYFSSSFLDCSIFSIESSISIFVNDFINVGLNYAISFNECPNGVLGFVSFILSVYSMFNCHISSSGFFNLIGMSCFISHILVSDLVACIGSIDVVFGEVDR